MKKTIIFFGLLTLSIAFFAFLSNMPFEHLSFITFSQKLHVIIETIFSILLLLIFFKSEALYKKTKDKIFLILGYGFLAGMLFDLVHIFTIHTFPYDNLSFAHIEKNPTSVYLFIGNIIIPLVMYYSLIFKPSDDSDKKAFRLKALNIYFYISITLALIPLMIYFLLPNLLHQFYILTHTLEYVNYALYLMLASILINAKFNSFQQPITKFTAGLLVLGLGGLFYINPMLLPIKGILAHSTQILGLLLILFGLDEFPELKSSLENKDKLAASLCLIIICFYVIFISIISALSNVIFPQASGYIFIEALLLFQLIVYIFSIMSWNKVANVYVSAEHGKILLRVYDSMRRISNPSILKNTIISEINKEYRPDKCFIAIYNPENNSFEYDNYYKFLPSKTLQNFDDENAEDLELKELQNAFNNIEISFPDINEYIKNRSLRGTPMEKFLTDLNIKSLYTIAINFESKLVGYLILQYKNGYKTLGAEDISFLEKMAKQIGIVIKNHK